MKDKNEPITTEQREKTREIRLFIFLVLVLFPLLTVTGIGAYGMAVWLLQMFTGSS